MEYEMGLRVFKHEIKESEWNINLPLSLYGLLVFDDSTVQQTQSTKKGNNFFCWKFCFNTYFNKVTLVQVAIKE